MQIWNLKKKLFYGHHNPASLCKLNTVIFLSWGGLLCDSAKIMKNDSDFVFGKCMGIRAGRSELISLTC